MTNINYQWIKILNNLVKSNISSNPRGFTIKEIINNTSCVDMNYPILTILGRKLGYKFMLRESWWIMDGRNSVETITDFSKAISTFSNDGFHFDGAYGPRVVDQIRYIVDCLEKDRDTRQAVLTIWRPNPRDSKDIPCTVSIQWLIRNNTIYCIDNMRSSDIWLGWPYDIFNFTMLTGYIMLLLRERGINDLKLGNIYLNAGSQHLYSNNFEAAENILNNHYEIFEIDKFNPYEFESPTHLKQYLKALSENDLEFLNNQKVDLWRNLHEKNIKK